MLTVGKKSRFRVTTAETQYVGHPKGQEAVCVATCISYDVLFVRSEGMWFTGTHRYAAVTRSDTMTTPEFSILVALGYQSRLVH